MKEINIYKGKLIELMKQAKSNGVKIIPYFMQIEGYEDIIEAGFCIQKDENMIQIPTHQKEV